MQSEKINPRFLITFTVMLLLQNMLLAVSPPITDDADTVEAGNYSSTAISSLSERAQPRCI
jgi:hypothetical protein